MSYRHFPARPVRRGTASAAPVIADVSSQGLCEMNTLTAGSLLGDPAEKGI